ncbi:TFIIB-type zinc ribbon-containing protein [Paludibaculum fermentans]|uniref:Zf-TFIIB domain-containing protein n=1 Tax=Paludibaculum fermentans TaxID=1473598 RepID=A0A7S7NSN9_PALFE|nr:zf-TFIIB domain-containing protein [Paludibaculum fermentans]QOY88984.1 zf-TFIIB domain-containing protein [Paludibaculum fermentans]
MPKDPFSNEQTYFALQEVERTNLAAQENQAIQLEAAREREKQLHFMKCPKCGQPLQEISVGAVRVDKCSACEGFWLEKGELEAIQKEEGGFLANLFSVFH